VLIAAFLAGAGATICLAAVGRVRDLQWISGPDLAFFHQSIWSASRGLGFAQTVFSFEGTSLLSANHFTLVRTSMVPLYRLLPHLETLVVAQALAVASCALLAWALGQERARTGGIAAILVALHPLTPELACTDFRPLVFVCPAVVLAAIGVARGWNVVVLVGGGLALAAREEGPLLIAALIPFAWVKGGWRRAAWVAGAAIGGEVLLHLVYGTSSRYMTNPDLMAVGLPGAVELTFMACCLVPALLLWTGWPLFLGAAVLWLPLLFAPLMEAAAPDAYGSHYLAFVYPLLVAGLAVGARRASTARLVLALVVICAVAWPSWSRALRRAGAAVGEPAPAAVAIREMVRPAVQSDAPVAVNCHLGPLFAQREQLVSVCGPVMPLHDAVGEPLDLEEEVCWGVLRADDPWEQPLLEAGHEPLGEAADWRLWCTGSHHCRE